MRSRGSRRRRRTRRCRITSVSRRAARAFGDGVCCATRCSAGDEHVVYVDPRAQPRVLGWLKTTGQRYDLLQDLTAVDYGGGRPLEVVYQLWSIPHKRQLRVKAAAVTELEIDSVSILADGGLAGARGLRPVRHRFPRPSRPASHPHARELRRRSSAAEGFPAARPLQPRGADAARAEMDVEDYYTPNEMNGRQRAGSAGMPRRAPDRAPGKALGHRWTETR